MVITIGASQIATILGEDPYMSPQALYEELRGGKPRETNEHMMRGSLLEDGLCNWWAWLAHATDVQKQVKLWHPNGWARATPDMLATVDGRRITVDTKCPANWRAWNERTGAYPFHYGLQVQWQLGVARACGHDVSRGELAAGPIYGKLLRFGIDFDPELFSMALVRAEEFLTCVREGRPLPETFTQKEAA